MTTFQMIVFIALMTYYGILFLIYLGMMANLKASIERIKQFGLGAFNIYFEFFILLICVVSGILVASGVLPLIIFVICIIVDILYFISFDLIHKMYSSFKMFFNVAAVILLTLFIRTLSF